MAGMGLGAAPVGGVERVVSRGMLWAALEWESYWQWLQCPANSASLQPHPRSVQCPKCFKHLCRHRFSLRPCGISPGWNTPITHPQYAPTQLLRDAGMLGLLPLATQFSLGRSMMLPIFREQLLCSSLL